MLVPNSVLRQGSTYFSHTTTTYQALLTQMTVPRNTHTGLVVMGRDSCSEGRGFDSQHRILDGHFSHLFVVKIVMMFV